MTRLTPTALDRIMVAVGLDGSGPSTSDPDLLREDLVWAAAKYETNVQLRARKPDRKKQLRQVTRTAEQLKQLLSDAGIWRAIVSSDYPFRLPKPDTLLDPLIEAANKAVQRPAPTQTESDREAASQMTEELRLGQKSAFEWLAGDELPKIFTAHSGSPATLARDVEGRLVETPFMRFAEIVLGELGIDHNGAPYTRESIAKALTLARGGETRR